MRFLIIFIILFVFVEERAFAKNDSWEEFYAEDFRKIEKLISFVENDERDSVVKMISYPLRRDYPLAKIYSEQEMLERYDEVFDSTLMVMLANSKLGSDWETMGWRGIMFCHGEVWFRGEVIGINYHSVTELSKRQEIIEEERTMLHPSIQDYYEPDMQFKTKNYFVRIDLLDTVDYNYRYTVWKKNTNYSAKPDLILNNGEWFADGSVGNYHYEFINGKYRYECRIDYLGTEESTPGYLYVYKTDELIIEEKILELWN
jgi:hypothetical protein